jgi:site-specific DNA recombinase
MRCVLYLRVSTDSQAERDDTEEGFSLPAQREACVQYVLEQGWEVVDEYVDHDSASKNGGTERPQFRAMLDRIFERADVDLVVVHKVDRFARDAAHHLAARAMLRKKGVSLVSVTERLEESASGRLVEGIHALMAEYYSANLSAEVKKGMRKKAQFGGWIHRAPLGYKNIKEEVDGRRLAYVVPDPERAAFVTLAFNLYATGNYTLEQLMVELEARGLRDRGRRDYAPRPLTSNGLRWLLQNKFYMGTVSFEGVEYQGKHEPLTSADTFRKVQEIFTIRHRVDMRERKHFHHLKGLLVCGVCGRKLSLQRSKGKYLYFFCLGQKDRRNRNGCRERYVSADDLEKQLEELYQLVQLKPKWASKLKSVLIEEINAQFSQNIDEQEFQKKRLERLITEKRKLLDAYYRSAIGVETLREEQDRLTKETQAVNERLTTGTATLKEGQEILDMAMRLAENCAATYRLAKPAKRKLFNTAVFKELRVRGGKIEEVEYQDPFGRIFVEPKKFEYGGMERETGFEPATSTLARSRSTK